MGWLMMTCTPVTEDQLRLPSRGQPHFSGSRQQIEVPGGRCLSVGVFTGWRSSLHLSLDREYKEQLDRPNTKNSVLVVGD